MSVTPIAARPPVWRRLIGFHMLTGLALGVGGWYPRQLDRRPDRRRQGLPDWNRSERRRHLHGLPLRRHRVARRARLRNYPVGRLLGRPPSLRDHETGRWTRYFRLCTDHKVVGIQYLFGVGIFFFIGGLNAMLMWTELLRPVEQAWPASQYLTLVSLHGTMMIMMTSAFILGPFGNYFVPIMIGARRMAFPRIEALTFWLVPAAGLILCRRSRSAGSRRVDGVRAVGDEARAGDGRLRDVVHLDRDLADARRPQSAGDDPDDARSGHELDAPAYFRVGVCSRRRS